MQYPKCYWPWVGLTIDPNGYITLCCNSHERTYLKTHIDDIDNILEFFLSETMSDVRGIFRDNKWHTLNACSNCKHGIGLDTLKFSREYSPYNFSYLELNMSNICNQMCVTCTSYFSSKWQPYEKLFDRPEIDIFTLSDKNLEALEPCFLMLETLQIKGGEPLADSRNIKIIEKLFDINDKCKVILCSNLQNLSKKWLDLISKNPDRFNFTVSIDGLGDKFNWIRGGDFDKVISNVETIYNITQKPIDVNTVVSIYNVKDIESIFNFVLDNKYLNDNKPEQLIIPYWPSWSSCKNLLTQEQWNGYVKNFNCDFLNSIECNRDEEQIKLCYKYTERMNEIRGFDYGELPIY